MKTQAPEHERYAPVEVEQQVKAAKIDGGRRRSVWFRLLVILAILLPLIILFLLPTGALVGGGLLWFWIVLAVCFAIVWMLLGSPQDAREPAEETGPRVLSAEDQPAAVTEVMDVQLATEQAGIQVFRGRLREAAATAYEKLRTAFSDRTVPMLQEDERLGAAVVLMPRDVEQAALEQPVRPWVHWLLFGLTLVTTTWAGAAHAGVNLLEEPGRFTVGLPYALGIMTILGVHELGHYFTARLHGIQVTPPYFIPVPFALGTFGAVIQMRSPTHSRHALFDVAIAGPLAGLVVAIPALWIGLSNSQVIGEVTAGPKGGPGTCVGTSLLFALISKLSLGDALQSGHMLQLSPLAFAGWLGLFVTALNLLPVGQLDGGHIAHAMFGRRIGDTIGSVTMWSLLLLGLFVWPGLLTWAIIVYFIAGRSVPPLNDLTPLTLGRQVLGYVALLILVLILAPLPHTFWPAAGIQCPYM
jgi:membrane-associated protease RseP (regulator of RpoE activity)